MSDRSNGRRDFLRNAGLMGSVAMIGGLSPNTLAREGGIVEDAVVPQQSEEPPKYHIKFAVCGISHDHIYGMIGAVQRGGGELVQLWATGAGQARRIHEAIS